MGVLVGRFLLRALLVLGCSFGSVFASNVAARVEEYISNKEYNVRTPLCEIMTHYGSDKGNGSHHNYTSLYFKLLAAKTDERLNIFEMGIGTPYTDVPSNMGPSGKAGASLFGWARFFPLSQIFGADIDVRVLFNRDRIRTFYCDQRSLQSVQALFQEQMCDMQFDLIIDDGLHEFEANLTFLFGCIARLKPGGFYIVEDLMPSTNKAFRGILPWLKSHFQLSYAEIIEIPLQTNQVDNAILLIQR